MAARGTVAKERIMDKLKETFPGMFLNGKEIRIPMLDANEVVEIKISLTCAKDNLGEYAGFEVEEAPKAETAPETSSFDAVELTSEEKARVKALADALNF